MIVYNVTINVEEDIHDEWLRWMKEEHIPEVMATRCFTDFKILRVITRQEGETGITYAIQYYADSFDNYRLYQEKFAPRLQQEHALRYKDKFTVFRTLLETVE